MLYRVIDVDENTEPDWENGEKVGEISSNGTNAIIRMLNEASAKDAEANNLQSHIEQLHKEAETLRNVKIRQVFAEEFGCEVADVIVAGYGRYCVYSPTGTCVYLYDDNQGCSFCGLSRDRR